MKGVLKVSVRAQAGLLILLLLAIFAVYGQVIGHDFVSFDDHGYIYENPHVLKGLDPSGIRWAFTRFHDGNWFPVTWLSIMADVQWFGTNAGAHHLMNVLYHCLNTILLYFLLKRMTGGVLPSLFVAALFALHPLHVESVAWASERKDVLSGTFWMATCLAYLYYVRKPGFWRYAIVFLTFAIGLMTKSMLVTLPVILLFLDHWPLDRVKGKRDLFRLIKEKIPLLGLSALFAVVTFSAQSSRGWVSPLDMIPLHVRLANAALSCILYLKKMLWPMDLAVFYPYELTDKLFLEGALSLCFLIAVTVAVVRLWRKFPFLAVGWSWYLVSLLPVIGIISVGSQSMADRYMYLPMIGPLIMMAWGIPVFARRISGGDRLVRAGAFLILIFSALISWFQVGYWRNTATLFTRALQVTQNNYVAHENLAEFYTKRGEIDRAAQHYEQAIKVHPHPQVLNNLGNAYSLLGRREEAVRLYARSVSTDPLFVTGWSNLGLMSYEKGALEEAGKYYARALNIDPDFLPAISGFSAVLIRQGRPQEAVYLLKRSLEKAPDDPRLKELMKEAQAKIKVAADPAAAPHVEP